MSIRETFAPVFLKLSFSGTLTTENARLRARSGNALLTLLVAGFVAAIAYADSRVDEISLGFLYILPIALSGLVNRLPTSIFFVVTCVVLHDLYGPAHTLPARIFLNIFAALGFSAIALLVNRLGRERQALSEIVRRQRDELTREIRLAAEVQQKLLPAAPPQIPGIEIACGIVYNGEMGGDYYDFIELPRGDYGIAVADVSGKRTAAAILMSTVEVALRLNALNEPEILDGLQNLNKVIYEVTDSSKFVTLFYGKLRVTEKTLEYINAGHNPPLLYRQRAQQFEWLESSGTPLGMFEEMTYTANTIQFEAGDILVCYTDGLSEAENASGNQFSKDAILFITEQNSSKSAQEIYDRIMESVNLFHESETFDDDLTLVVLKISP